MFISKKSKLLIKYLKKDKPKKRQTEKRIFIIRIFKIGIRP